MSVWLAVLLAVCARADTVGTVRAVVAPASAQAGAVSLAKMYEGQRFVPVGATIVDTRAPGAPALVRALDSEVSNGRPDRLMLGIFRPSDAQVLNGFAYAAAPEKVTAHKEALPFGHDPADVAGYSLGMKRDTGEWKIGRSAGVPGDITPAVTRAVRRYYGLLPAQETRAQKWRRRLADLFDAMRSWF